MKGYKSNIEKVTRINTSFRRVVYTSKHMQLVLMNLKVGEEIGSETHSDTDQFFRFEGGNGRCMIDKHMYRVTDGDAVIVPAGAKHNIINTDKKKALKIYTIYAPPHHKDGIRRKTKATAEEQTEEFDGETTEKAQK